MQTIIKITTVLYLLYSTLDILWHIIYGTDFQFDPRMHKPTNTYTVEPTYTNISIYKYIYNKYIYRTTNSLK